MPSLRRRSESRHPSAAGAEPQVLDGHPWGNAAAQSELGLARQGLGGGATSFPFADRIAASMGDHDLYGVQAFLGGLAAASCEDLGAEAYAVGDDVAFSGAPDLWTAAHEAAHVIQQRAGIALSGGSGQAGDAHERNADAVADRVVAGRSAADLLPDVSLAAARPAAGVQFYREDVDENGRTVRVSDDGAMQVGVTMEADQDGDGRPDATYGSHDFEAMPDRVEDWNDRLDDVDSVVVLHEGAEDADGRAKIEAENEETKTQGDDMEIWADCGRSGRDVMGAGEGTGGGDMEAVYFKERSTTAFEDFTDWLGLTEYNGIVNEERYTSASKSPEAMKKQMLADLLGCSEDDAIANYEAMSEADRDAFDRKAQINRYAMPEVGEGFTMSSGGNSLPVANDADRSHDSDRDGFVDQWNFHWGGVVARSGGDVVTLENYATGVPNEQNSAWEHQMYGSKDGQSFHDYHKATKQHGDAPITMRVREAD